MVKIMENPIKMDDLGVPLFLETPIYEVAMLGFGCLQDCILDYSCRFLWVLKRIATARANHEDKFAPVWAAQSLTVKQFHIGIGSP